MSLLDTYTVVPWKTAATVVRRSSLAVTYKESYELKYLELIELGFEFTPQEGPYFGTDEQLTEDGWSGEAPHDGQANKWLDIDNDPDGWMPKAHVPTPWENAWALADPFLGEQPNLFHWHAYVTDPATLLSKGDRYAIGLLHRQLCRWIQIRCAANIAILSGLDNRGRPVE